VGTAIPKHRDDFIVAYTRGFIEKERDLFERRVREGRVREGHGDLYSANICFDDIEKVYIFDCIEFNERFRCGDVASEVAFLAMDLDYHGQQDLSRYFVERFVELSGDKDLLKVLDFYKTYRAYVRGKIGCFTWSCPEVPEEHRTQALDDAKRYFSLAYRYAGGTPTLIVVFGLAGTGKTTLSEALKKETLALHISTDRVRKSLAGVPPEEKHFEPFEKGIYSPEFTERTYQVMLEQARKALLAGNDVILDGTYRDRRHRNAVLEMADALGVRCLFVQCVVPDGEVKRRLHKRLQKTNEASDARWETYLSMKERFEPPEEIPEDRLVVVETIGDLDSLVDKVLSCL
jgi:predicted kinase